MVKLAVRTWIRHAAAVFSGRHGAVSEEAKTAGCSRQAVYDHGRKLEERLAERDRCVEELKSEVKQLREELTRVGAEGETVRVDTLRRFAIVAQAMGISLRQAEELLGTLLPAEQVPDHATMGRWTAKAGQRATEVLAMLDPLCAPAVTTLCVDEIFLEG